MCWSRWRGVVLIDRTQYVRNARALPMISRGLLILTGRRSKTGRLLHTMCRIHPHRMQELRGHLLTTKVR